MSNVTKRSFGAGELAPAWHARADHERYATGLKTCRNFYIRKSGGAISRPGTKYIGESRYNDKKVRLIPWIFSESQAYVIELGENMLRIIDSTAQDYLYTATQAITAITNASPGVLTVTGHGFVTDDVIKIEDVGGMDELNDRFMRVVRIGADTFSLKEMDGTAVDTSSYSTYTLGGTVKEPYSIGAANSVVPDTVPWAAGELEYVTFAQSGDVMTLCHTSYAPKDLVRFDGGVTPVSWRLLTKSFGSSLDNTGGPTFQDEPTGAYQRSYFQTTVVADTGDESVGSTILDYAYEDGDPNGFSTAAALTDKGSTGIAYGFNLTTGAEGPSIASGVDYGAYVVITSTSDHDWSGFNFTIKGITHDGSTGSETIKGPRSKARVGFSSPYKQIDDVYADGVPDAAATLELGYDSLNIFPLRVTSVAGVEDTVTRYRLYRADVYGTLTLTPAFGFVAESKQRDALVDEGGTPDYTRSPPVAMYASDGNSIFASTSNYPAVVGYYQQRLILARSLNEPETVWMSRTGLYYVANSVGGKTGTGDDFTLAAGVITLDDAAASFAASDVGLFIHVYGSTTAGNDGRFTIATVASGTQLTYANTAGATEAIAGTYLIVPDHFANFNISSPVQDDNAIRFSIASGRLDRPWHVIDVGRLLIFTDSGEWIIEGDSAGVITPTQINPRKISYSGSTYLRPLVIQNTALFVQGNRKTVRDLVYEQQSTGYQGNDLTVFSQHLFDGVTIADWTYQQDPDSLVWMVLSDGAMLSMSYLRDFNMYGWARHDTPGTSPSFISACSIPNGSGRDDVYVSVLRTINGRTFRSIEVMSDRFDTTDADLIQMDATVVVDYTISDSNVKGIWKLDETVNTADAVDSSGNSYDGLPVGTPEVATGKIDGARQSASSEYFELDGYNSAGAKGGTGYEGTFDFASVTWEGWAYINTSASNLHVANNYQFDGPGYSWRISFQQFGATYRPVFELGFDDAPTYTQASLRPSTYDWSAGEWIHLGFTFDDTSKDFNIYVNGVNRGTSNHPGVSIWYSATWAYWPRLGAWRSPGGTYFDGLLDHWRVHNVARPASFFRGAAAKISGLWHLEGEDVSVFADGTIIASPYNSSYTTLTVSNGSITLTQPYDKIQVGLPVVNDLETLDIDSTETEVHGEQKLVSRVAMSLQRSSRCWVGAADPGTDGALTNLDELDIHAEAGGTSQSSGSVSLANAVVDQQIKGDWNSNGRVFIRNVDPIPLNVLSISPAVLTGPRGAGKRRR